MTRNRQKLVRVWFLRNVIAGFAAGCAVVEAVFAEADGVLSQADVAVAVAVAAFFGHFAGGTAELRLGGQHSKKDSSAGGPRRKVPLVTCGVPLVPFRAGGAGFDRVEKRVVG